MNETGIIWTEATWNPMSGCTKISPECKYCYAHTLAENKRGTAAFPNGFDLTIREHKLAEPRRLKTPSLIFTNSMSDLFLDEIPDSYRDRVLDTIRAYPQHQFQVLTKRPLRAAEYFKTRKVPANYWAGVTVGHPSGLWRIDALRQIDAEIRFLSCEPLLAPLDLGLGRGGIHWVIGGGESGMHLFRPDVCAERGLVRRTAGKWIAREDRKDWARTLRDQCFSANVKFFWKQWGGGRGHDAGRDLDGRTWDEFPRLPASGSWQTDLVRKLRQATLPIIAA